MSEFVIGVIFIVLCIMLASIILFEAYDADYEEISDNDNISLEFEEDNF